MAVRIELKQIDLKGKKIVDESVFNILNDYLQLGSSTSTSQAAIAISKLAPEPSGEEKTLSDEFFFGLWKSIIGVAEQIPPDHFAQDKLVGVLRELTLLPDSGVTVWGARLWTDLPVLGAVFREHLNGPGHSADEEEQGQIDLAWIRFHAFSAKLIGAGVVHFENQPIWMLREALEEQKNPVKSSALDRDLITAAMYIEFSGPVLVEALAANPEPELSDELRRILKAGTLFSGGSGLRLDRWSYWTKRFREEAEKTKSEKAKAIALRTARLMEVWTNARLSN
ncbi:uncharacterized protein F4822DRAFT_403373 [Hypoxylon trugodes]|uniref:uncharacterized protein n=1 Tax=Hypoxylon trugodes TaxID=326681 RepID=UPI00219C24EF|nr:uncharacterized protein F4822DRAFT_403373 [Hypoxylon trugodes]KAI1388621.1 hypothetical protein F4822DRAFT_403373 [Hypoxylon trugodes]